MNLFIDMLSSALLLVGGAFVFIGGVGALRFPDFYTRMHAAGLTDTMGSLPILLGCALQTTEWLAAIKLLAVLLFLLLTSPTAAYALAHAARLSGQPPRGLVEDEDRR